MLDLRCLESLKLTFNCFKPKVLDDEYFKPADELDIKIYNVSRQYKISILPISHKFDIDNLYPLTDHVELWNIFIVGNDKTYILASINDEHTVIPQTADLLNKRANNILPEELVAMFDSIWDKTLLGHKLQFYMVWNTKLYFINTYPFYNGKNCAIGAILFMRAFEKMPEQKFTSIEGHMVQAKRLSLDK